MKLGILAAGESSRIKEEGIPVSKALLKVQNEFLIDRIMRITRANGINSITCIINENETQLKEHINKNYSGLNINLIIKNTASSMHSLFELSEYLKDSYFLLTTVDAVYDEREFRDFLQHCKGNTADGILAVTGYIDDEKPLCVKMDENNNITEFSDIRKGYSLATGGIYYFSPKIFSIMEDALDKNIQRLRNFLRLLLSENFILKGYRFSKIIDVDHVSDILKADEFLNDVSLKTS